MPLSPRERILGDRLEELYRSYGPSTVESDPIVFVGRYAADEDREVAGWIASEEGAQSTWHSGCLGEDSWDDTNRGRTGSVRPSDRSSSCPAGSGRVVGAVKMGKR